MELKELTEFMSQNMIILAPVLYILGKFLKQTPHIKDWTIPWVLLVFSALLAMLIGGFNINSFMQGVIAAGVTVLANQLVKQTSER